MTSPMASLRKTRRAPLHPASLPFRTMRPPPSPSFHAYDDSALLEEVTSNMAATQSVNTMKGTGSSTGAGQLGSNTGTGQTQQHPDTSRSSIKQGPSDHELMMLMTSKLTGLEKQLRSTNKEMAEKDKRITMLEEKLRILRTTQGTEVDRTQFLEKKCLQLQQQVHEMEDFLADYGMIWVGEKVPEDSIDEVNEEECPEENHDDYIPLSKQKHWNPAHSVPSDALTGGKKQISDEDFSFNFDLLVSNVTQLNLLAGEGVARVQRTTDGARLKLPDPVQLAIYSNGLLLFNGPFRPYTDLATRQLVQDILEGYFPSELKDKYPAGIPLTLTDKRGVYFKDRLNELFKGEGQVLGSKVKGQTDTTQPLPEEMTLPGRLMGREQFLNALPRSVIKSGKIIDVRQSIGDVLTGGGREGGGRVGAGREGGAGDSVTVIETPVLQGLRERLASATEIGASLRPVSSRNITTLRVKSESGDRTYILKMNFNDTIGDVRKYIDKERPALSSTYNIKSTFPSQLYEDVSSTLLDCGLTPNATLHLIRRPR